jgi:DNA repair photolyase
MMLAKRFGKVTGYEDWCNPRIVENALELLKKEIPRKKDKTKSVQLCFSTDPFMYGYLEISEMSVKIIKTLNAAGIRCTTLTKGILPAELATFSKDNEHGISLISLDEEFRKRMEPNTAPFVDRIAALKKLHEAGCKTWVSIEPYPTPNIVKQDYDPILEAVNFVDKVIFGRLNYNKEVTSYKPHKEFFNTLAAQTIEFCDKHKIKYHIKKGTITVERTENGGNK